MVEQFEAFDKRPDALDLYQEIYTTPDIPQSLEEKGPFEIENGQRVYHHPKFDYYPGGSHMIINKKRVKLSPVKNKLLYFLSSNLNRFVNSPDLKKKVWGENNLDLSDDAVRITIFRLKRLFQKNGLDPNIVINRPALGYSLTDPSHQLPELAHFHSAFMYYPQRGLVNVGGKEVLLRNMENSLLDVLAYSPNQAVSYDKIAQNMWGLIGGSWDRRESIRVTVLRTRKKIEPFLPGYGSDNPLITAVGGIGYMLRDHPEKSTAKNN